MQNILMIVNDRKERKWKMVLSLKVFEITKLELVRSNFNLLVHVWTCTSICTNLEVLQAEQVEEAGLKAGYRVLRDTCRQLFCKRTQF